LYVTRPLLTVLLELAADAEPNPANVQLVASAAEDLEALPPDSTDRRAGGKPRSCRLGDLDPGTPVFSDFYFPDVGNALDFVFGVDLGTPAGQSQGRFLSHPDGDPDLSVRDDLHATVLVAVPPWQPATVSAYDRDSTKRDLVVVEAGAPDRDFEG
jgi:proteasome lid subunit RPN8/RPN11